MSDKMREFYIANVITGASGQMTVIGRAGDQPIPVGTPFKLIYKLKKEKYPEGYSNEPVREKARTINLTVLGVSVYGQPAKQIPGNTTGSLVVDGKELDALPPGWMLSEESQCTSFIRTLIASLSRKDADERSVPLVDFPIRG